MGRFNEAEMLLQIRRGSREVVQQSSSRYGYTHTHTPEVRVEKEEEQHQRGQNQPPMDDLKWSNWIDTHVGFIVPCSI